MDLRKTFSRNSGVIAQLIYAGACGLLPVLTVFLANFFGEKSWQGLLISVCFLMAGFLIAVIVLHKLSDLPNEVVDSENDYKKQWELYGRLIECQKKHQRMYFYVASFSIVCLIIFLTLAMYYGKDTLSIVMLNCWWAIPLYFAVFLIITLYCLWEIYAYKINYYSNDSIQLLWEEIEKLKKKLKINDIEKFKEELAKAGNKEKFEKMIYEYGIGYQPKDYVGQPEEITKDIINTEIMIIRQMETIIEEKKQNKRKQDIIKQVKRRFS